MTVNNAHAKYLENSILVASPGELVLMLYKGLAQYIMIAQKAIEDHDVEKAHYNITKAQDIIVEFQSTLDMQYEISHNLMLLYDYMHRRLVEANVKKDRQILDEVLQFTNQLRDTWAQAMKIAKEESTKAQVAK